MRKLYLLISGIILLAGCHESLEERAARETRDFTEKNCPTPVRDNTRTDSLAFDKATRTLTYYYTLCGQADNADAVARQKEKLTSILRESVRNATQIKAYKDAGFNIRYVYHSEKDPKKILFDNTFTTKDY